MFAIRILLLFAFGTAGLFAQENSGSVSGRVVDLDTNAPVSGVTVGSRNIGYATSGPDGRYTVRGVAPGPATIFVQESNGGYLDMSLTAPRHVVVSAGREITNVDFRVRLDGTISGRVVDENDQPIGGIQVIAVYREYTVGFGNRAQEISADHLSYSAARGVTTDDRGRYAITSGVFAGRAYWILAYSPTKYGNAIADVPADIQSRRHVLRATYFPNADRLSDALPIVLHSMEHRENVDIRMPSSPSYCIDATLRAGGSGAQMRFTLADEEIYRLGSPFQATAGQRTGESGADGRIRVCDLYPGQFQLAAYRLPANGNPNSDPPEYVGAQSVTITNGDVKDVVLEALPPVAVTGAVVWDSTPPDGPGPSSINIRIQPTNVPIRRQQLPVPGAFSVVVPASYTSFRDSYSLTVFGLDAPFYIKDVTYGGSSILRKSFLPAAGPAELRVVMAHDAGRITVKVADENGNPAPRSSVLILPANAQSEADLSAAMFASTADDNGLCVLNGIPPGTYFALATNDPPPSRVLLPADTFFLERSPETLSMLLRVRSNGRQFDLAPGAMAQISLSPRPIR
jgi:uncharacterized protein (DUF736 family)